MTLCGCSFSFGCLIFPPLFLYREKSFPTPVGRPFLPRFWIPPTVRWKDPSKKLGRVFPLALCFFELVFPPISRLFFKVEFFPTFATSVTSFFIPKTSLGSLFVFCRNKELFQKIPSVFLFLFSSPHPLFFFRIMP